MRTAYLERLNKSHVAKSENGNGHELKVNPLKPKINPNEMTKEEADAVTDMYGWPRAVHIGEGMWVTLVNLTPDVALAMLKSHNSQNRNERKTHVNTLARDMEKGNWMPTHQACAVDENGDVIDGQHRAAACVQSGKTVKVVMFVYRGRCTANAIDVGINRSYVDQKRMTGNTSMTNTGQAMLRFMHGITSGGLQNRKATGAELDALLEMWETPMLWVLSHFKITIRGVCRAGLLCALMTAYGRVPEEVLERFIQILVERSADSTKPEEQTVLALLRHLDKATGKDKDAASREELFFRAQRAIEAFAAKEVLQYSRVVTEPVFPLAPVKS